MAEEALLSTHPRRLQPRWLYHFSQDIHSVLLITAATCRSIPFPPPFLPPCNQFQNSTQDKCKVKFKTINSALPRYGNRVLKFLVRNVSSLCSALLITTVAVQMFRHLHVLASERRLVDAVDVDTAANLQVPITILLKEPDLGQDDGLKGITPFLLPPFCQVS